MLHAVFRKNAGGHSSSGWIQILFLVTSSGSIFPAFLNQVVSHLSTGATLQAKISVNDLLSELKNCTRKRDLPKGRRLHKTAVKAGINSNISVGAALINLYAKCGGMEEAREVFNSIQEPNVVCWTVLIMGYADNGQGSAALDLFSCMKEDGRCTPNSITYVAALKACTLLAADGSEAGKKECLERGRQIHSEIGRHMNHFTQNTLVNLYAKCSSLENAMTVFNMIQEPNVVSWNCLIMGYAENGKGIVALDLFSRMKNEGRCEPNSVTYLAALKACTFLAVDGDEPRKQKCLEMCRQIHFDVGYHMNISVQNTLINMYAKCGIMEDAKRVFDSIEEKNVVSWNCLILGYAENGKGLLALDLFSRMKDEGKCVPSCFTYVAALMACCLIGALAIGRKIHSGISEFNSHVVTSLVDFYAKCGSIEEACEVFDLHPQARSVSTWNAFLAGHALFEDTGSVFSLFETMQDQGFQPNDVTFVCVLSCCCHAGLIEKAWEYLEVMPIRYGVTPTVMHYSCMIDLLGRANKLDDAVALLHKMPCDPNLVTWTALLCACRKWKNYEIGRWAFTSLRDLDSKNASDYVLMAEIYGSRGMWDEQERVLEARKKSGACKLPGKAHVIDGQGRTIEFMVGKDHPVVLKMDCRNIYE